MLIYCVEWKFEFCFESIAILFSNKICNSFSWLCNREWNILRWMVLCDIIYKYVYEKTLNSEIKYLKFDDIFQSSACFLFLELFFTDSILTGSIFIEYGSSIFSLALPKLPPNFLMRESDMIKPAMLLDCCEQIVFHGMSIEMTLVLLVL